MELHYLRRYLMDKKKSLLYSSGSIASGLPDAVFSTFIIFFYIDYLKMPPALIGLGMTIYGIWNAINDPLFGQISDKTKSKFGRRIPYIKFGALPLSIAFILVWTPPVSLIGKNTTLMFAYFLISIFLYDALYSLVILNWTALFPDMYRTQEERTSVSSYRQIFGIVATLLGAVLPPVLYEVIGWPAMAIIFAVITYLSLKVSLLGSYENPELIPKNALPFLKAIKAAFSLKSFISYIIAVALIQFTFYMLQAGMPFYAKYVLKVDGIWVSAILGIIFVVSLFFVGIWARLANTKGTKTALIISTLLFAASLVPLWFAEGFITALAACGVIGIGLAGVLVLLDVLLSDIIDEDELKTGLRREGMYFGINALLMRLGISAQALIISIILKNSGYNASLSVVSQPAEALIGMRIIVSTIPIAALLLSLVSLWFYPKAEAQKHL
jgi:glycoside/pentoside/hexuronide:cation symporter, GPH family